MRIVSVVGTRPNFVKMAPVVAELRRRLPSERHAIVHTGQHYDAAMSDVFLSELDLGAPDYRLDVGSGSHAQQTARTMERLEPVLVDERPDLVLVPGDVNSTLAATLVAAKLNLRLGHVESGLRSFDRTMPEEVNRVVADALADLRFVHCADATTNLLREGIDPDRIHFVGNTMIDTLRRMERRFRALEVARRLGLRAADFLLVTLHRPALVDGPRLGETIDLLGAVARELPVVFPVHPRTAARLAGRPVPVGVRLVDPLGYLDFLSLEAEAAAVLTDSGGIQEETTALGVPCFTLRDNTERPVTVSHGTNTLLGLNPQRIIEIPGLLGARRVPPDPPPCWDGRAAERLADVITGASRPAPPVAASR